MPELAPGRIMIMTPKKPAMVASHR
jgi:hypothetical protein